MKVKDQLLIGELAHSTGASARSLRHYESKGLLQSNRTAAGYRAFDPSAATQVRRIRGLLEAGFDLGAIAAILPCVGADERSVQLCPDIEAIMRKELDRIDADMDDLARRRTAVHGLLG